MVVLLALWLGIRSYLTQRYAINGTAIVDSPVLIIFIFPLLLSLVLGKGSRQRELAADRFAVDVTGDAELVVRALTRIHDLNAMPHRLKVADEATHTHPSLERRVAAIREYASNKR